jgi:hypothetical protein
MGIKIRVVLDLRRSPFLPMATFVEPLSWGCMRKEYVGPRAASTLVLQ